MNERVGGEVGVGGLVGNTSHMKIITPDGHNGIEALYPGHDHSVLIGYRVFSWRRPEAARQTPALDPHLCPSRWLLSTCPIEADVVVITVLMRHSSYPHDNATFTGAQKTGYWERGRDRVKALFLSRLMPIFKSYRPLQRQIQAINANIVPFILEAS
jgi:hypothetical protein